MAPNSLSPNLIFLGKKTEINGIYSCSNIKTMLHIRVCNAISCKNCIPEKPRHAFKFSIICSYFLEAICYIWISFGKH